MHRPQARCSARAWRLRSSRGRSHDISHGGSATDARPLSSRAETAAPPRWRSHMQHRRGARSGCPEASGNTRGARTSHAVTSAPEGSSSRRRSVTAPPRFTRIAAAGSTHVSIAALRRPDRAAPAAFDNSQRRWAGRGVRGRQSRWHSVRVACAACREQGHRGGALISKEFERARPPRPPRGRGLSLECVHGPDGRNR